MRYRLKKTELLRACLYLTKRQYELQSRGKGLFVLLLIFILSLILGAMGSWSLLRYLFALFILLAFSFLVFVMRIYRTNARTGSLEETELVLENGVLKIRGKNYSEWQTEDIFRILRKGSLTLLVRRIALGRELHLIIPDRVFADQWQKDNFLRRLSEKAEAENPAYTENAVKPENTEENPEAVCPAGEEALFSVSFNMDRGVLLRGVIAANSKMVSDRKHSRLFGTISVTIYMILVFFLAGWIFGWQFFPGLFLLGIGTGILAGFCGTRKGSVDRQMIRTVNRLMKKKEFQDSLGGWKAEFYEDRILLFTGCGREYLDWRECQGMLELSDLYVFYGEKLGYWFSVPKPDEDENRRAFLLFCNRHVSCEVWTERPLKERPLKERRRVPIAIQVALCTIAAVVWLAIMLCVGLALLRVVRYLWTGEWDDGYSYFQASDDYEDFVFDPEEYPDYVPIEEQIAVLTELGFEVPEGALDYYEEWMKDSEYGKLYVEGYPYYTLLTDIGSPHYDMESYEFLGYSSQAYWFDFEGWDISTDYLEILEGVQALTQEEVAFVGGSENCDDVNWNNGTGVIRITFWCNGSPYEYDAKVEHDWLDAGFVAFLNEVLEKEGYEKRIYACSDDGQGNILFYRDEEWAEEFMKKTGLVLGLEAQ